MPGVQTILDLRKVFGVTLIYDANQAASQPFEAELKLNPGGKSAVHLHPEQEEFYHVTDGVLEVFLDGKWNRLGPGKEVIIPKGVKHAFRNGGTQKAIALNKHIPGLRMQAYFESMQRLIHEGKITGTSGFRNSIYLSLHTLKFADLVVLIKPPNALIKAAALGGKMLGYKI